MKKLHNVLKKVFIAILITSTICGSAMPVKAATTGTKSSPHSLTLGSTKTISVAANDTVWFSFKARGDIKLTATSSQYGTQFSVYKKGLFSNTQVGYTLTTTSFEKVYSLYSKETYLVAVNPVKTSTVSIKAQHNQNVTRWANGGTWRPNGDSAVPSTTLTYLAVNYYPAETVYELYNAVNEDAYLTVMDKALSMTTTAAITYLEKGLNIKSITAAILYNLGKDELSFTLKDLNLDSVKKYGGYNASTNTYKYGICQKVYLTSNGAQCYTYSSWTDDVMYGISGYSGKFTLNKK